MYINKKIPITKLLLVIGQCTIYKLQIYMHWCRWPESNRHGLFNRRILSPVRLPIPPHLHLFKNWIFSYDN